MKPPMTLQEQKEIKAAHARSEPIQANVLTNNGKDGWIAMGGFGFEYRVDPDFLYHELPRFSIIQDGDEYYNDGKANPHAPIGWKAIDGWTGKNMTFDVRLRRPKTKTNTKMNHYTPILNNKQMDMLENLAISAEIYGEKIRESDRTEYPRFGLESDLFFHATISRPILGSEVSFAEMAKLIAERIKTTPKSVPLNEKYTATRDGDYIVVGCQKFLKSNVEEAIKVLFE